MPRDLVLAYPPQSAPPALEDRRELMRCAAAQLQIDPRELAEVRPTRLSFDARPRHRGWRLALRVWTRGEEVPAAPRTTPPTFPRAAQGAPHVLVVGSGPAGLFAALDLLAAGKRVTVLERGRDVRERRRSIRRLLRGEPVEEDSNYCFGEGGAGTYSDGKLYTRSGSKKRIREVLETLVAHGALEEILVSWRPHVGSNRLPEVVRAMRETIRRSGGEVRFRTRVVDLTTSDDAGVARVRGVRARDLERGTEEVLEGDAVVLATGHSALDALRMAARAGARLEPKGFAMGVRIEHPQPWVDERQYGGMRAACELPAAFYELTSEQEGRGVYSFCMCPGGFIVPTTTDDSRVVVNGMSLSRRDSPFANSGLVVAIEPEDWCGERGRLWGWAELLERAGQARELPSEPEQDPLFGVRLQLALETVAARAGGGGHRAPGQNAAAFVERGGPRDLKPTSYRPGLRATELAGLLPTGIDERLRGGLRTFDGQLPGFSSELGQLIGVETRTSSPVRIARDRLTLEAEGVRGLWPCGEGAGYAGGIVSAALDGRRTAAALQAVVP